ncbi:MAG: S9 family peptidase [Candidatus Didemnitutus sp.]|nr:S9 family peptidase [Candidatus Didemnitutus sp.]
MDEVLGAKLSPDGEMLGMVTFGEDRRMVTLLELASGKAQSVRLGNVASSKLDYWYFKQVDDFDWAGDERVIIYSGVPATDSTGGVSSADKRAENWIGLSGDSRRRQQFSGSADNLIQDVVLHVFDSRTALMQQAPSDKEWLHPNVVEMDIRTGEYRQVEKNPGDVNFWLADEKGMLRVALVAENGLLQVRDRELQGGAWRERPDVKLRPGETQVLAVRAQQLYFSQLGEDGRWALYAYDLSAQPTQARLVFADPEYDVASAATLRIGGQRLPALFFEHGTGRLLGVRYVADGPKQHWFDAGMAEIQQKLDAVFPDQVSIVVDTDAAGRNLLVFSSSAKSPGAFFLLNQETWKMKPVASVRRWVNPQEAAEMFPIALKARDGLPLHGYLTLPPGAGQTRLPLVVMVHDGPGVRDVWGYDATVQFIANRGYAVLQVNYRGSPGYGERFRRSGRDGNFGAIVDDVVDATRWVVQRRIADPQRIAIMGLGLGGYAALSAMGRSPELYRCGVGVGALCDWQDLARRKDSPEYARMYAFWMQALDLAEGSASARSLIDNSPVARAKEIQGPILLMHSETDQVVPVAQAQAMKAALKRERKAVELKTFDLVGHGYLRGDPGEEFLTDIARFLASNLRPRPPAAAAAK